MGVDRVFVSLPNGAHEQDVKTMLELYDHPEDLTFLSMEESDMVSESGNIVREYDDLTDKMSDKQVFKGQN